MIYVVAIAIILFLGLKAGRKYRARAFDMQRIMGDMIALRNGTFVKRWVRKQGHKRAGRFINKLKGK